MAKYKLTRTGYHDGKVLYEIKCMDEWDGRMISWNYQKLDEIAMKMKDGEEYIFNV
jgi:hypothetical protein